MSRPNNFRKQYNEYIKEFKEQQDCGKVPETAKPVTYDEFIPDSFKY